MTTTEPSSTEPSARARTPRRRRAAVAVILAVVVIAAVIAVLVIRETSAPEPTSAADAPTTTVPVTTGDMVAATNARATLHYSKERALVSAPAGVVTALPTEGTVVAPGGTLYRVDNLPVVLLRGSLPAWRTFETGMTVGEDVRQLEENLTAFGVFRGVADTTFTRATADAISSWQKGLGVERSGKLERTAVLFSDHDLRVTRATAALGAGVAAGAELYLVSATDKIVDLDLRLADQRLAVVGNPVGITLPDGTTTAGVVATVGEPLERETDEAADASAGGSFVVPVTVTITDQAAADAFPRASVMVQFSSTLAESVLTVPVEALIATDATTFAVETPGTSAGQGTRRIPVTVGAFASGRVQITGEGVSVGMPVVVPES